MKKQLFLSIIVLILFYSVNGATNRPIISQKNKIIFTIKQDTNRYLQTNFISHKENFKHEELNKLLKQLNLTVKSYQISLGRNPKDTFRSITLYFQDPATISDKIDHHLNIPFLTISFESYVPQGKALGLYSKTFGEWGAEEKAFYGKMLVRDVTGL